MKLEELLQATIQNQLIKLIISNRRSKQQEYSKATLRQMMQGQRVLFQLELQTQTQCFHENLTSEEAVKRIAALARTDFRQMDIQCTDCQYAVMMKDCDAIHVKKIPIANTAKTITGHNREKQYLLPVGEPIAPLVDLGVMQANGQIIAGKQDKFRQINRFLEIVDDVVKQSAHQNLHIVDFGCGKSYVTFILYYYFTKIKQIPVTMVGLDLKADVIASCNAIAQRYGYEDLQFMEGDIARYQSEQPIDMVITLHACDTATDYALYHAVQWQARYIFSVPCCQHEMAKTMRDKAFPIISKYGILKERFAALTTDAMRGQLLEIMGYDVQLLEYIDDQQSLKNIMIRAKRGSITKVKKDILTAELQVMETACEVRLCLHTLLEKEIG